MLRFDCFGSLILGCVFCLAGSSLSGAAAQDMEHMDHSTHDMHDHAQDGHDAAQHDHAAHAGHQRGALKPASKSKRKKAEDHSHMQHGADGSMPGAEHAGHGGHAGHDMKGFLGPYDMAREGSGTSWLPDATPHEGVHAVLGGWSTMWHALINLAYDHQGGPRGGDKTFVSGML